jgi:hypothetical protein
MGDPWEEFQAGGGATEPGPWDEFSPTPKTDLTGNRRQSNPADGMSGARRFGAAMGGGFVNAGLGALQRVLEGGEVIRNAIGLKSNQANIDRVNAMVGENRSAMNELTQGSIPGRVGEFLGNAAPYAAIPGGVAGGIMRRIGSSALSGGMVGALQPTAKGESATLNAAIGALTAGGISGLLGGASKIGNVVTGNIPETDAMKLARRHGISITLGEATDNPLWKTAESWLERVPIIGMKGFREKQNAETQRAATTFFAKYVRNPSEQTTAAMKTENDAYIDGLYKTFRRQITNAPPGEANAVKDATKELIDRFPSIFNEIQDTNIKRILKGTYGDVREKVVDTGLVSSTGKPITRQEPTLVSVDDLWELRKGIGKEINRARRSGNETAEGILNRVYGAATDDMDAILAQSNNPAMSAFREANNAFKQYSLKFDVLRQAYDRAAGTTGAVELFSPKTFSTALKNLANNPEYKKNVRWTPQEVDEMTGLANILQVAKRGGQFMENPPTGNRWGPLAIGGGVGSAAAFAGGPATLAKAAAGTSLVVGAMRFLTETTFGKRLALSASKLEPDNPIMAKIVTQVMNQAPKMAALGATGITKREGGE